MLNTTSKYIANERIFHGYVPYIMGTRFDILLADVSSELGESCWTQVVAELQRLDKILNRFDPTSEVARLNQSAFEKPFEASVELWSILKECEKYHQMTNGVFDVTLKDFGLIRFHPKTDSISFKTPSVSLDFGGYAKGYALEKIKQILKSKKIENAFIDFGNSSIMGLGRHPYGDSWKISIENPFNIGEVLGEFTLSNTTLTTSGNTPGYTAHIINPFSGIRNEEKKCVCLITRDACEGEVLSTVLIAASMSEKQEIIAKFDPERVVEYNL